MARRLLAIWMMRLPSDLWLRRHPVAGPFALVARQGSAEKLYCTNEAGLLLGLLPGMTLADARAIYPDLITAPADPLRDRRGLHALRRLIQRYAPQVGLEGEQGLIADITGVAHLFGGETELRGDLQAMVAQEGFALASAIAPTRAAAWALSRHGGGIIPEGAVAEALRPLPVAALRLEAETGEGLARLGILRIGDLMALPRAPLAKRFGPALLRRLDQALGHLPEPVSAPSEDQTFSVRLSLPEPIGLCADVMAGLERLLSRLCARLAQAQKGARRLRFELHRVDREVIVLEVGLARPMREAQRIAALFAPHVDRVDAGFGIERLRLEAHVVEALAPEQIGLAGPRAEDDLTDLISGLGNRLGFEHILRAHPAACRLPEKSFTLKPAAQHPATGAERAAGPEGLRRPLMLFPPEPLTQVAGHPPTRFRWRQREFTTLRLLGPERIAPDWWQEEGAWKTGLRDYWQIETHQGPRLWLFHTPQSPAWAVQGEFL